MLSTKNTPTIPLVPRGGELPKRVFPSRCASRYPFVPPLHLHTNQHQSSNFTGVYNHSHRVPTISRSLPIAPGLHHREQQAWSNTGPNKPTSNLRTTPRIPRGILGNDTPLHMHICNEYRVALALRYSYLLPDRYRALDMSLAGFLLYMS